MNQMLPLSKARGKGAGDTVKETDTSGVTHGGSVGKVVPRGSSTLDPFRHQGSRGSYSLAPSPAISSHDSSHEFVGVLPIRVWRVVFGFFTLDTQARIILCRTEFWKGFLEHGRALGSRHSSVPLVADCGTLRVDHPLWYLAPSGFPPDFHTSSLAAHAYFS
eukprot:Gregarina_sp_Poly_1__3704@NODE_2095_length_2691_cov_762_070884_g1351_i0_p3_GENE_NODE_2095_length_2691_cov_762_070884_g1351_i0NODE_2095_length_2691_cov_762_070884_g1351_i0_p3_ORF_typecomplete_len162_score17_50_NODE_2095_length_2691_cov_762_070884_g1351_i019592444